LLLGLSTLLTLTLFGVASLDLSELAQLLRLDGLALALNLALLLGFDGGLLTSLARDFSLLRDDLGFGVALLLGLGGRQRTDLRCRGLFLGGGARLEVPLLLGLGGVEGLLASEGLGGGGLRFGFVLPFCLFESEGLALLRRGRLLGAGRRLFGSDALRGRLRRGLLCGGLLCGTFFAGADFFVATFFDAAFVAAFFTTTLVGAFFVVLVLDGMVYSSRSSEQVPADPSSRRQLY